MNSPISYYGGKQRMSRHIVPLIPRHTVYVEPFAGGLSVMFAKPYPEVTNHQHYREVVNDLNSNLVNFYQVLRTRGDELRQALELTLYSREEYDLSKTPYPDDLDSLERARRYYFNLNTSFTSKENGGLGRSVVGPNHAFQFKSKVDRLGEVVDRFSGVYVENRDALQVIRDWDSPQTFFYCDPPYPNTDQGHYDGYSVQDFQNLVTLLHQCEGSWLLSNYDVEGVEFDPEVDRFEFTAYSSARGTSLHRRSTSELTPSHNPDRTEVVWRRFSKGEMRPDVQELLKSPVYDCFTGDPVSRETIDPIWTLF